MRLRRNWRQFNLRWLMFFVLICAVGIVIWQRVYPAWQNDRFAEAVLSLNGRVSRTETGQVFTVEFIDTPLTDEELAHLARMPGADGVKSVWLENTFVTDDGLAALADFERLDNLWLPRSMLTDRAVTYIAELPKLTNVLLINNPEIKESTITKLKQLRPELRVESSFDYFTVEDDPSINPDLQQGTPHETSQQPDVQATP